MSTKKVTVLAVDLGAESGRVMAIHFDGHCLSFEELSRFSNPLTTIHGTTYWDFLHLWREITAGIERGKEFHPASVGVDAWGVDFALLDAQGRLLGSPVYYRDPRTDGMMDVVFSRVPREEVFARTGIQFMPINTLYQVVSLVESGSPQLGAAETFLTVPDLLNYWLTGEKVCEFTNATTTQMYDPRAGAWALDMLRTLGIPPHIFPEIVPPGTRLGEYEGIPVIAPATHDTGSAVAGVPTATDCYAYISSGTWSLVGLEVAQPIICDDALAANVTNEGGVYDTFRLLKNVMGLWIIQQCRATWAGKGSYRDYAALAVLAEAARPLYSLVNPDDPRFLAPGDHPTLIREMCRETGQVVPQTKGAVLRCALDSLALKYHQVLDRLQALAGITIESIHIVGGGSQNQVLNQATANATGLPVVTGPVEATVLGNALVQLIALGEVADIQEGRRLVAESSSLTTYTPQQADRWRAARTRFDKLWPLA
jgi:rhamnulokinase